MTDLTEPRVQPSTTVALNDLLRGRRQAGLPVYDLSSGDPDLPTPSHIVEAGRAALAAGHTHYAPSRGIPGLLDAIADYRDERTGVRPAPDREIIVTPSAKYAVAIAVLGVIAIGEPVLVVSPSWVSYEPMVQIAGGVPYHVDLDGHENFALTAERLESGYRAGTRLVIVNTPNNPTGRVLTDSELDALAGFAHRHDLIVLSDEIYEELTFDRPARSVASQLDLAGRTIVVSGFSKSFAMTGWRVGYLVAPAELTTRLLAVHQHIASCTATFVQDAAEVALRGPRDVVYQMRDVYRERMAAMVAALNNVPGLVATVSDGTFYVFVELAGTRRPDSTAFARWALDSAGVSLVPGLPFGASGTAYVRVAATHPVSELLSAVGALASAVAEDDALPGCA